MIDTWNGVRGIGLILTLKCPAACKCCGYNAGPNRSEVMAVNDARDIIDQASKIKGIENISFSGGEPFLYLPQLEELISYANDLGLNTTAVTNGFWARDLETSMKIIDSLQKKGLKKLAISIDDFHNEYIPLQIVKNAVMAVDLSNIHLDVQILKSKNNYINKLSLTTILDANGSKDLSIYESSIVPVGRASKYFNYDNLEYGADENGFNMGCPFVIEYPVIAPNGDVSACCGLGSVAGFWYDEEFIFGNIKNEKLKDIFEKMENDLLLNFISINGPYKLIELLKKKYPEAKIREEYINICDVCLEIFSHKEFKNELLKLLIPFKNDLYIKKMYSHYSNKATKEKAQLTMELK